MHEQAECRPGRDDAPPGMYFTAVNAKVIQTGHKNRLGIFSEETGTAGLFIEAVHIDLNFLDKHRTPHGLGAIAFTLVAITAHLTSLKQISLIAASGKGTSGSKPGRSLVSMPNCYTVSNSTCRIYRTVKACRMFWLPIRHGGKRKDHSA